MLTKELTIKNKLGLHARPSALLAKTASLFHSTITISYANKTVDAKSILGLMTLALPKGEVLTVTVQGSDEETAMQSIADLFNDYFGEEQ